MLLATFKRYLKLGFSLICCWKMNLNESLGYSMMNLAATNLTAKKPINLSKLIGDFGLF